MPAKTLSTDIGDVLEDQSSEIKAKELIKLVKSRTGASESSVRSELSRMKDRGEIEQPRYGYYQLRKGQKDGAKGEPPVVEDDSSGAIEGFTGTVEIRIYDVRASAGGGQAAFLDEVKYRLSVHRWILRRILGIETSGKWIGACQVVGDCMLPHLKHGDLVFFEHTEELRGSARHVLWLNDEPTVKRVQRYSDGDVLLMCDNDDFENEILKRNADGTLISERGKPVELHVIGPVIWPTRTVTEKLMQEVKEMLAQAYQEG